MIIILSLLQKLINKYDAKLNKWYNGHTTPLSSVHNVSSLIRIMTVVLKIKLNSTQWDFAKFGFF